MTTLERGFDDGVPFLCLHSYCNSRGLVLGRGIGLRRIGSHCFCLGDIKVAHCLVLNHFIRKYKFVLGLGVKSGTSQCSHFLPITHSENLSLTTILNRLPD